MAQRRPRANKATLADGFKKAAIRVSDRLDGHIRATSVGKEFQKSRIWTGDIEVDLNLRPTFGSRLTLVGNQHMGKTLKLYQLMSATQRTCRLCLTPILWFINDRSKESAQTCRCGENDGCSVTYFDQETEFDENWAAVHGVQLDAAVEGFTEEMEGLHVAPNAKFAICRVQTAEQASTMMEAIVEGGFCDLIGLDSIAALNPYERVQGKKQPGDQARAISRMTTSLIAAQAAAWIEEGVAPTFIATNQYRMDIAMMNPKADPRKAAGGNAYQYGNMQEWQIYSRYNSGESDRTMQHTYSDMRITAKKDKQGGATNSVANLRIFLKDFKKNRLEYKAGETDAPEKLFALVKEIAAETGDKRWYDKRSTKMTIFGRTFKTAQAVKEFLRRPDIAYMTTGLIASRVLDAAGRAHIRFEDLVYTPFKDEPMLELLDEAKGSIGEAAKRDVGARHWMDQLPKPKRGRGAGKKPAAKAEVETPEPEEPEAG